MTEDYHRDMSALKAMIQAVEQTAPAPGSDEENALNSLKKLLKDISPLALNVGKRLTSTRQLAKALKADKELYGRWSTKFGRQLDGLKAAGVNDETPPLNWLFLLLEDGNPQSSNPAQFLNRLREAFGATHPGRSQKLASLGGEAEQTAIAADALFQKLQDGSGGPGVPPFLLASALDALLPVAESVGLPPATSQTLQALRKDIEFAGGGGPGSGYWPSNYVYSSSSSGGSSSSSNPGG